MATAAEIQTAYRAIYRTDLNATVATAIANTGISVDAYIAQQLPQVASTTQAAVAIASFVTGTAPTSDKLDALKVAADAQVASYTQLGSANPSLGAYEAFGRSFATDATTTAGFNTKYGALSTADFVTLVYAQVYGTTPSAGAAANLTAQITYFTNLYTANNVPNAALAAKGAVLGQIVGYAFTSAASANSNLDNQVQSLLTSAAKGDATVYNKALPVVVDPGQAGVTITLQAAANEVSPTAADPAFKTTANNDTINGTLSSVANASTIGNDTKIDGGSGNDTLKLNLTTVAAAATYTPSAGSVVSVEDVFVKASATATFDATVDFTNLQGVKNAWLDAGSTGATGDVFFSNLALNTVVGLKASAAGLTIDYTGATATVGNLAVDGLATGGVTFSEGTVKTVNVSTVASANSLSLVDAQIEAVKVAGTGSFSTGTTTLTNLKTFDASGVGTFSNVNLKGTAGTNAVTVTLGAGADTLATDTNKAHTVTLGAGPDSVEFNAATAGALTTGGVDTTANINKGVLTVTDFLSTGASRDSLRLDVVDTTKLVTLNPTQLNNADTAGSGAGGIKAALDVAAAATLATAAEAYTIFKVGADSFVYYDATGDGLSAADDVVIKLTGVDFSTIKVTGADQNVFFV